MTVLKACRQRKTPKGSDEQTRVVMIVMSQYPSDPRVRREAETLEQEGIHVDVICLRGDGEPEREQYGRVTAYRVVRARKKERLIEYLLFSLGFSVKASRTVTGLARRHAYKLCQVHNMPDYLVFAALKLRMSGVPVVLDLHDLSVELFASKWTGWKTRMLGPLVRSVEALACKFADHLITASDGFKARLTERGVSPEKITVVLNTADTRIFRASNRVFREIESGPRLVYHGTVAERFGVHVAIEALPLLQKSLAGAVLQIRGKYDPAYRGFLERRIRDLGIEDAVNLGSYVSLEEIAEIIRASDVGVVPYLSDAFMDLALSTKTFEYVAMRLPVVASRLPSLTSIFDESCIAYSEPGDAEGLAESVVRVCADPEARQSRTRQAARAYERIAWPIMQRRYVGAISKLMGRCGSS